jgi:hypothetical protein
MNHDSQVDGVMPAGYAVRDVEVLLLDEEAQPVEPGQVGEIAVRSRCLASGYWHRPEATREKFLPDPNPQTEDPSGHKRIYLTGDLGRMAPDGRLTVLGRKDFQAKIRGYRVEIAEIEAALADIEQVQEAVVDLRDRPNGEAQLVGYLVPARPSGAPQPPPTVSSLRRQLGERLPDYMIPSLFVVLDALPLTANDKVDRRALPSPGTHRPNLEQAFVAPRTAVEEALAEIWAEVLGLKPVGIHDNFFELGGHSLMATQVVSRASTVFRSKLALRNLFESPTIAGLAQAIVAHEPQPGLSERIAVLMKRIGSMSAGERAQMLARSRSESQ